jgi:hypothetical protein
MSTQQIKEDIFVHTGLNLVVCFIQELALFQNNATLLYFLNQIMEVCIKRARSIRADLLK